MGGPKFAPHTHQHPASAHFVESCVELTERLLHGRMEYVVDVGVYVFLSGKQGNLRSGLELKEFLRELIPK